MEEVVQSLVTCITEITRLADGMRIEQKIFMEFTRYLKETLSIVLEVQRKHEAIPDAVKLLDLLLNKIAFAKDLVYRCSKEEHSIKGSEIKSIIRLLEGVTRNIGEDLLSIPSSSAFEDDEDTYIRISIQSLSKEMMEAKLFHQIIPNSPRCRKNNSIKESPSNYEEHQVEEQQLLIVQPPPPVQEKGGSEGSDLYPEDQDPTEAAAEEEEEEEEEEVDDDDDVPEVLIGQKIHPRFAYFLRGKHYSTDKNDAADQSFSTIVHRSEAIEPLYDTFFCPLTGRIMEDPVTLRSSGITYERKAITEWLKRFTFDEDAGVVICPTTGRRLESRTMIPNLALKSTIEEWIRRNGTTRMTVARSVLLEAISNNAMLKAMGELRIMCRKRKFGRKEMCDRGFLPLLCTLLEFHDKQVRCEALQTLTFLVEDHKAKEIIGSTGGGGAVASAVRMLLRSSDDDKQEQDTSLSFLLELSKSDGLVEKIGSAPGAVRMLIKLKGTTFSEKAELILKNLGKKNLKNIKCMAESGFMEPLLNNLVTGTRKMRVDMAEILKEVDMVDMEMVEVGRRAGPVLMDMTQSGDQQSRQIAFKALLQISCHRPIGKTLVEVGMIQVMMEEVFSLEKDSGRIDSCKLNAADILFNLVESVCDPDQLRLVLVNLKGNMNSDDATAKLANMVRPVMPNDLNLSLIKTLTTLLKFQRTAAVIVNALQETGGLHLLIDFLNHRNKENWIVSLRFLVSLCPYSGQDIADVICTTRGHVNLLLEKMKFSGQHESVTQTQLASAELLSAIPYKDLNLNRTLVENNTIGVVLKTIEHIFSLQIRDGTADAFLEALVGILVRFTATLQDDVSGRTMKEAQKYDLATVFTQLLVVESDEVQRLAAVGLGNLSLESTALSLQGTIAVPNSKSTTGILLIFSCCTRTSTSSTTTFRYRSCPIHRGVCSASTTFCLLESNAIGELTGCLEHGKNVRVIEASLAAIRTLLGHETDVDVSLRLLAEKNTVKHVLRLLTTADHHNHRNDKIWHDALFIIDLFSMRGGAVSINQICNDTNLRSALLTALQTGDSGERNLAERILKNISTRRHNIALQ